MDPKRFLSCSLDAALVGDVAWHVHREGHDVKYSIEAESDRVIAVCGFFDGDSFVDRVNFNFEHYLRDLLYNSPRCTEQQTEITAA